MTWKCTNTPKGENKLYSDAKGVVPSLDLRFAEGKNLNDYMTGQNLITFSRSSIGTYVDENGIIQTATADTPRFDHDPTTGESLGLLMEEARTNLTPYSEFQSGWAPAGVSFSPNYSSPDGLSNANLVSESAGTELHYTNRGDVSVTVGTTYCFSVYYKKGTGATAPQWIELGTNAAGFGIGDAFTATFDIENGVKGSAGASIIDFNIIDAGNGWYRCWMTGIATATTTATSLVVKFNNNQSTPQGYVSYKGQTTSDVFVFGAQVEAGSFPTSYIPTTGTALTRSADVASITGSNFSSWYNQGKGTFLTNYTLTNTSTGYALKTDDTTSSNVISFITNSNAVLINTSGAQQYLNSIAAPSIGTNMSVALSYETNNVNSAFNGSLGVVDTSASIPVVTQLRNTGNTIGPIARLTYFPERLPDSSLQTMTAP